MTIVPAPAHSPDTTGDPLAGGMPVGALLDDAPSDTAGEPDGSVTPDDASGDLTGVG